jgi:hypothetical protein
MQGCEKQNGMHLKPENTIKYFIFEHQPIIEGMFFYV